MPAVSIPLRPRYLRRARRACAPLLLLPLLFGGAGPRPDTAPPRHLPFAAGESFTYRVRLGRLGSVGQGTMRVEGPTELRGRSAYLLRFDVRARIGLATVQDSTRSWIDPQRMATLRYYKREQNPLGRGVESVEVFPEERRWSAADGRTGETPCASPLDELSFLYYLRTLPLKDGDSYRLEHHFDATRNPVLVNVVRREEWTGPVESGQVVVVEMRVSDAKRVSGDGTIRLYLTDDDRRVPVRIETKVPVFGTMVLTLESAK